MAAQRGATTRGPCYVTPTLGSEPRQRRGYRSSPPTRENRSWGILDGFCSPFSDELRDSDDGLGVRHRDIRPENRPQLRLVAVEQPRPVEHHLRIRPENSNQLTAVKNIRARLGAGAFRDGELRRQENRNAI